MTKEKKSLRSLKTRAALIEAAEQLIIKKGYDSASVREITQLANANLASVSYHFDSKEDLIKEVIMRRLKQINNERIDLLNALETNSEKGIVDVSALIEAYFGCLLSAKTNKEKKFKLTLLRLLERTMSSPNQFIKTVLEKENKYAIDRYVQAFVRAMPEFPQDELIWRLHFMFGATAYAIAGIEEIFVELDPNIKLPTKKTEEHFNKKLKPRLLSFLIGGMLAPIPTFEKE